VGQPHTAQPRSPPPRPGPGPPPARSLEGVDVPLAAALDPTGGTLGTVVAILGLVAALVVLLRWWFRDRGR